MNFDDTTRDGVRKALIEYFQSQHVKKTFIPGETYLAAAAKSLDENDLLALGESAMDLWLTSGRFTHAFEKALAERFSRPFSLFVNSGSSANLLAVSSLCAQRLGEKRLRPGDEVITVAAGFPTTVNPILQNALVPVLIDVELGTYNTTLERVEEAIGPKTRAIMIAHTLGNPYRADLIAALAEKHGLYFIEDCCDALGSTIAQKPVGAFADLATLSFYPAHHMTTGEGGAVVVKDASWKRIAESLRDWGRDCWCDTGKDNTCKKRFDWKLGDLPVGYDHKYIYSEIGYNFKATDLQASLGLSQLSKLDSFVRKRKDNFARLYARLAASPATERLALPNATPGTEPSWFGFALRCLPNISRREFVTKLENAKVGTRLLFAGNISRQPAYKNAPMRVCGSLENSDTIMNDVFWVGIHPQLDTPEIDYIADQIIKIAAQF